MRPLQNLQSHITPLITAYIDTLEEAFADINNFLDEQLESDFVTHLIVAGVILTPIVGSFLFVRAIMLSA